MINLQLDLIELSFEAYKEKTTIMRVMFDNYIYKYITRREFEVCSRGHNNSMVQISDHGTDHITVRIKTKGATEEIG